ncbi:MAG: DNA-3-methyladenine glycosylase 2 family protein [Gemmatimonadaceae bacterium]|jgi:DNA-3-methyladenine glycosylase II|nr:DNA-3-methyladenine glycosylase 2 family protein [Gemmatimonadaceae bacterium]
MKRGAGSRREGAGKQATAVSLTRLALDRAQADLSARDAKMAAVIERVGPCTLLPRTEGTHFGHLARNIIYQQLSGSAAATIHGRFAALVGGEAQAPDPHAVLALDEDALRRCGLSVAKIRAVQDLARHVVDDRLPLHALDGMSDDEIIAALVPVRGIGPWTAQMFLMFRLGRPDVLPVLDLGVRKGAQRIYRTRALPDATRLTKIARNWRPWASVASWYCWRVLDLEDAGGW